MISRRLRHDTVNILKRAMLCLNTLATELYFLVNVRCVLADSVQSEQEGARGLYKARLRTV